MSANHALGAARVRVGLRTELAYQLCSQCQGLYPSLAECVCVYCDATVCPSCAELLEDIDEAVCLSCVDGAAPPSMKQTVKWPAILEPRESKRAGPPASKTSSN